MISRRDFIQVAAAAALLTGASGRLSRTAAAQRLSQGDLLRFPAKGQLTLLHMADLHAQLKPVYFREPSVNLGVGEAKGRLPHLTDRELLAALGLEAGSLDAYMLSSADYEAMAREYGRVGGMDRIASLVRAIRAERGEDKVLLLDGGDALQGSYTSLVSRGADMVSVLKALGVAATTGHWEFTLGATRIAELFGTVAREGASGLTFLANNVRDNDLDEPVFHGAAYHEVGGVKVAVIGQAFPYTPIANPRWMIASWSFGIRERDMRAAVAHARRNGARVVVLLSHNGFDVDRKMARRVAGIDVILTAHTHDALPAPERVGDTLLVASGSHGKFLSRLDLEVRGGRVVDHAYRLIPVLADAIAPDPDMARLVEEIRAPHAGLLETEVARTEGLLYRRGTFGGSLDDLICDAILAQRDAEIVFSPGFRWGASLVPGQAITWDDIYNATAITYPAVYRRPMTGAAIKAVLEDVADNIFNPDPYYQQGGDMVRVGGLGYTINVDAAMGQRITALTHLATAKPIEADRTYIVAGWASVSETTKGPPVWELVAEHLRSRHVLTPQPRQPVKVVRAG
ncbi:MAG: thiosulfohydrolase SoxB [Hyphomicrobiaceae bacterium]|nr:thiosulfohydrolase SoxB [Hyphomicrobiaceae bacterium]